MQKINVGLLAFGMSGKVFHAPFVHANAHFNLYAVVERTKKEAQEIYPTCLSFTSIDDLLADASIELVIVNTPNNTHYEFAKKALLADKHVLIEKPFSVSLSEAEELFDLAKSLNLQILAYQNRRFDSDFLSVKKVIDSAKLGKIHEVHIRFDRYRNTISPKKFKETNIPGAGIWYDLGAHLIDQAICLFGKPDSFTKRYAILREEGKVDDYACAHLVYGKQLNVFVTTNMLVVKPQAAYVLNGSKGTFTKFRSDEQENQLQAGLNINDEQYGLEKPHTEGTLTYFNDNNELITESIASERGNYNVLFNEVYQTIRNKKAYFISPQQILAQIKILEK